MKDRYGSVVEKVCSQNTSRLAHSQLLSQFMLSGQKCAVRFGGFRLRVDGADAKRERAAARAAALSRVIEAELTACS